MREVEPIPIPPAVRWREYRTQVLPFLVFVVVAGVAIYLWRHSNSQGIQGIGEGMRSMVAAEQPVRIQKWLVEPYSVVSAGTPLVEVVPVDPRANFDLLRSVLEMGRVRSQPSLAEDNAMSYERIRVELLKTRSELAIAKVKLGQAERDVARNGPLYREKLVSEDIYEMSVNLRDALKAEVEEKEKAATEIESRLADLRPIGEPGKGQEKSVLGDWFADLEKAHGTAAKSLEAHTLLAPIDGMMGFPQRQAGEFAVAGDPLVTVSSVRSQNVVAYLRQPYQFEPQVGMKVEVTTRGHRRQAFQSLVTQVGAQVEVLTNALAYVRPGYVVDVGLPIIVPVPRDVTVRPGELVDVVVARSAANAAGNSYPRDQVSAQ